MSRYLDLLSQRMGYETYPDYLRSRHWREFVKSVRKRWCFACQSRDNLQVHHITYERFGCELPQDVITVCDGCHEMIHRIVKRTGVPLDRAHFELLRKGAPNLWGITRERWVYWKDLCNPSLKETPEHVHQVLRSRGLMLDHAPVPTPLAFKVKMVKIVKKGPRRLVRWRKSDYISLCRDLRRNRRPFVASGKPRRTLKRWRRGSV